MRRGRRVLPRANADKSCSVLITSPSPFLPAIRGPTISEASPMDIRRSSVNDIVAADDATSPRNQTTSGHLLELELIGCVEIQKLWRYRGEAPPLLRTVRSEYRFHQVGS
jgi:hypothetical protein